MENADENHRCRGSVAEELRSPVGSVECLIRKYPELFAKDSTRLENLGVDPWWPEHLQPFAAPGENTLLSGEWMEWFVQTYPERVERIKLETLAPEVSAMHRVLAELRIFRDRLRGIERHQDMEGRLLAGWESFRPKVLLRFLQNDLLRHHVFSTLLHPAENPSDGGQDGKLVD